MTTTATRIARPNIVIRSESMIYAQTTWLRVGERQALSAWADDIEARRIARGEDAEDARPSSYAVPVLDRNDVLIGHVTYRI